MRFFNFSKHHKRRKNCTVAVKTYMSKAYDRVEWRFIERVLQQLGFHWKWTQLIMQCLSTVSYSYLISDTVHGSVIPQRGIRHGVHSPRTYSSYVDKCFQGYVKEQKERVSCKVSEWPKVVQGWIISSLWTIQCFSVKLPQPAATHGWASWKSMS